ncbi:MAG: discoidin domain-containing protein [Chthoniobacterales bacterium]
MLFFFFLFFFIHDASVAEAQKKIIPQHVTVAIDLAHPTSIADLSNTMGGGIDGHDGGEDERLSPQHVHAMLSAGLKPLSYRLRTELGIEAWHWNPMGTWSDERHHQGYWTSSTQSKMPITKSYGYRLPRRGNTLDEANNDSCSRLDDGNPNTFWKSNPYLTEYYTGESDAQHPQWILIDFGKPVLVNAARLYWKDPYAKQFRIQYSRGGDLYFGNNKVWHDFPKGNIHDGRGGSPILDLGTPHTLVGKSLRVQYVRIVMTESSGIGPQGSSDPRDAMGYALGEVEIGFLKAGKFQDHLIHRPDQRQTLIYVSSTDPWHRASDRDEKTEQPGLDLVAQSGLGNHQPILWSVPFLYDTPENAAAEVDFLQQRGYLFASQRLELGEEPDGQRVDPKDVAELYDQTAKKIHHAHPKLLLGGLSFVTIDVNPGDLIYRVDKRPWLRRFFKQLQKKVEQAHFQFLTFEWYPFDDLLLPAVPLLTQQPRRLQEAVKRIRHGGIPAKMPLMISEYGYSVFSGEPEVTLSAALLHADIAAQFMLLGGTTSYLYGYEPGQLECSFGNSWGNLMMFLQDQHEISGLAPVTPLPTYYGAQLITKKWAFGLEGPCDIYPATTDAKTHTRDPYLTAYFLRAQCRGQKRYSLLLVNKNPTAAYRLQCRWKNAPHGYLNKEFSGAWRYTSYCSKQYQWHAAQANGYPLRNKPPVEFSCQSHLQPESHGPLITFEHDGKEVIIPPWSITVLSRILQR